MSGIKTRTNGQKM